MQEEAHHTTPTSMFALKKQHGVINFLTAEGNFPAEIDQQMVNVHGENVLSKRGVKEWAA